MRHRVRGYRAGDLERRYPQLDIEEDVLYAYGFASRDLWQWLHARNTTRMSALERRVLAAVEEAGEAHPRQLDERFGGKRVVNAWGGWSRETKQTLEALHRRGLLRVARRDKGVRVYALAPEPPVIDLKARFRNVLMTTARVMAPVLESSVARMLAPVRRRRGLNARAAKTILDELVASGELERIDVGHARYLMPAPASTASQPPRVVRFLAPFDPVVWDRDRFERLWGWPYRFEAYTPRAKRVRGYYAMPMLWGDDVIGWANVDNTGDELDVQLGFCNGRPAGKPFARELEAEIERLRAFLR